MSALDICVKIAEITTGVATGISLAWMAIDAILNRPRLKTSAILHEDDGYLREVYVFNPTSRDLWIDDLEGDCRHKERGWRSMTHPTNAAATNPWRQVVPAKSGASLPIKWIDVHQSDIVKVRVILSGQKKEIYVDWNRDSTTENEQRMLKKLRNAE